MFVDRVSNGGKSSPAAQDVRAYGARLRHLALATALGMAAGCGGDPEPIVVMTRNLFLGADLAPLFLSLDVDHLKATAGDTWRQVQASRFEDRAEVLATEIVAANPDVVSLQEATLFRTQTPGDWESGAAPNATEVSLDLLQVLLDALASRGAHYQVAGSGSFTDDEIPAINLDGTPFDIRLTDRNAILVREGLSFAPGPQLTFNTAISLPIGGPGGATLTLQRGYVSTDVTVASKTVRVVDSHLEVGERLGLIQEAQGDDLLVALAPYRGPLILAGDFNSPADGSDTKTYARLTNGIPSAPGFHDAWQFRKDKSGMDLLAGFTCCLDLPATDASPQQRIDLVLFRGNVQATDARMLQPAKTPSGLWPSDHLGVVAQFLLP